LRTSQLQVTANTRVISNPQNMGFTLTPPTKGRSTKTKLCFYTLLSFVVSMIIHRQLIYRTVGKQFLHFPRKFSVTIIILSVSRHIHILSQSQFTRQCVMVLPPSISSVFSSPFRHPGAAYVFFLVFPSLLSFLQ